VKSPESLVFFNVDLLNAALKNPALEESVKRKQIKRFHNPIGHFINSASVFLKYE
jgi:hypothetical protein